MIQCKNVMKKYGDKQALNDFSLELEKGRIIGLLGSNGSGKTTLIKILAGLLTTEAGIVKIDEKAIGVETKRIVSYLPERPCFSSSFRIRDIINSYFYRKSMIEDSSADSMRKTWKIIIFP